MTKQKCKRCKWEWEYTGHKLEKKSKYAQYTGCPKCYTSVKLKQGDGKEGNDGIPNNTISK